MSDKRTRTVTAALAALSTLLMLPAPSGHLAAAKGDRPGPSDPADVYGGLAALAEFADEHGLTGLSPASLRRIEHTMVPWSGDAKDHPGYGPASA